MDEHDVAERVEFRTEPARYRHWRLELDGPVATVVMDVDEAGGLRPGYELKLNSYDLGVDIELYDVVQRLRFEHPEVRAVVVTSGKDRVFSAGANIRMLATAAHPWKVNFCKFTNETRNGIEDATACSGQSWLAALNGPASGGGYELALACDRILLVDDRSSAVSLPELPLLAVLPGTGGLTRVVDKRGVRRDLADWFATRAEGVGGRRAAEWRLVDEVVPRDAWDETVRARAREAAERSQRGEGRGCALTPLGKRRTDTAVAYRHVQAELDRDAGVVHVLVRGPEDDPPADIGGVHEQGADFWTLAMTRELDDLVLDLRTNELELGTWVVRTSGDPERVLAHDRLLVDHGDDWLANEIVLYLKRTLKRLDVTSRSLVALAEPGSCFAGSLLELALACDRTYQLDGTFEDAADDLEAAALVVGDANLGPLPMGNGLTRLQSRFFGDHDARAAVEKRAGERLLAADALALGLVTFAPGRPRLGRRDPPRAGGAGRLQPRRADRARGQLPFRRARDGRDEDLRPPVGLAELDLQPPERRRTRRRAGEVRHRPPRRLRQEAGVTVTGIDFASQIPNNVGLSDDRRLQRALESWLPNFLQWWRDVGPAVPTKDVYVRTAVNVGTEGWAHFDHVPLERYRWGIILAEPKPDRRIGFGVHRGEPAWQQVPGEYRPVLRRLIVVQGDTEPASVEQQRYLGRTAPSIYDLRNLFQVNVEEARHLWAMVYLLHAHFGRDGREEAEQLLERRSGSPDAPRILGAFNEQTPDWLSFFLFTYFTDRDGKYQLGTLKESGFDPLSRTCEFMLKEEAHHMFVGTTGVDRVVERTAQLMVEHDTDDIRPYGAIPLAVIQRYLNFHYSVSLDLFGSETSTNVANYFSAGVKGRWGEEKRDDDHVLADAATTVDAVLPDGSVGQAEVPALVGLNTDLRRVYVADCQTGVDRWNRMLDKAGVTERLRLPSVAFNRRVGAFAGIEVTPEGGVIPVEEFERRRGEWLPTADDRAHVESLMSPVYERGRIASWLAPPKKGINGQPFDFDYVHLG